MGSSPTARINPSFLGDMAMPLTTLVQHIKKGRKNPRNIGTMVAKKIGDKIFVGFSLCRLHMDKFDKHRGKDIAEGRIDKAANNIDYNTNRDIPKVSSTKQVSRFIEKAKKYFRTDNIILVGVTNGVEDKDEMQIG